MQDGSSPAHSRSKSTRKPSQTMAAGIDKHRIQQEQEQQKLTASNLERHTTGRNQASFQSNVRRYLKTLQKPDSSTAKEPPPSRGARHATATATAGESARKVKDRPRAPKEPPEPPKAQEPVYDDSFKQLLRSSSSILEAHPTGTRKGPSIVESMKSKKDTDAGSQAKQGNGSSIQRSSKSPFLEPRVKAEEQNENAKPTAGPVEKKKGKKRKKASGPPPDDGGMSSSSEDIVKVKPDMQKKKRKMIPESKEEPDEEEEYKPTSKGKGKAKEVPEKRANAKPRAKKKEVPVQAKTREETEWEDVLAQRKERCRAKAVIVKDRTTVTAASKKALAAQKKIEKEQAESSKQPGSKSKPTSKAAQDPPNKSGTKKRKRKTDGSEASSLGDESVKGEYEEEFDITTEGKEKSKKRKRLTATEKGMIQVKDSTTTAKRGGRRKDPLSRASNIAPTGRMTLKSGGIYNHGQASTKVKVNSKDRKGAGPLPDLAFNEAPFLDQPSASVSRPVSAPASPPHRPFSKSKIPLFRHSETASLADSADENGDEEKKGQKEALPELEIQYLPPTKRKRMKSKIAPWLEDESTKSEAEARDKEKEKEKERERRPGRGGAGVAIEPGTRRRSKDTDKGKGKLVEEEAGPSHSKRPVLSPSPKKRHEQPSSRTSPLPPSPPKYSHPISCSSSPSAIRSRTIDTNLREGRPSSDLDGLSFASLARRKAEVQANEQSSPTREGSVQREEIRLAEKSVDHGPLTKSGKAYIPRPTSRREVVHPQAPAQQELTTLSGQAPVSGRSLPSNLEVTRNTNDEDWLFSDLNSNMGQPEEPAFETGLEGLEGYNTDDTLQNREQGNQSAPVSLSAIDRITPFKQNRTQSVYSGYSDDGLDDINDYNDDDVDLLPEAPTFHSYEAPPPLPTSDLAPSSPHPALPFRMYGDQVPDSTQDPAAGQLTLSDLDCYLDEEDAAYNENGIDLDALQRTIDLKEAELANLNAPEWQPHTYPQEPGIHHAHSNMRFLTSSPPGNQQHFSTPFHANVSDGFHISQGAALGLDVGGHSSSSPLKQQLAEFWRQNRA